MTQAEWFRIYSESHQNPVNRRIHRICVPLIVLAQTGLLWLIPSPFGWPSGAWASLELLLAMAFYLSWKDVKLAAQLFALYVIPNLAFWYFLATAAPRAVAPIAIGIFVTAWVGQFVGHHIEGKEPSFLQDLKFLLIGPAWVLRH